jgi:hypothetical protein
MLGRPGLRTTSALILGSGKGTGLICSDDFPSLTGQPPSKAVHGMSSILHGKSTQHRIRSDILDRTYRGSHAAMR